VRFLALTVPGVGPLLRDELSERLGAAAVGEVENDGRADVVPFAAGPVDPVEPRLAEDLLVEVGTGDAGAPLPRLTRQLWSGARYDAALPAIAPRLGRLGPRPGFRVVARLRDERSFRRTELRDELARAVLRERPRWRPADPAQVELWALQTRPGRVRLGVRLTDDRLRRRAGRQVELPGALRPAVAAALVRLAVGRPGRPVLDPCCGSGTILREALASGRRAIGSDRSAAAVAAARANLPGGADLLVADVRGLPLAAASVGAVATNLPFGRRHPLDDPAGWLRLAFGELERVVAPGGRIVVLSPRTPAFQATVLRPRGGRLALRLPIRLLGLEATIWAFTVP